MKKVLEKNSIGALKALITNFPSRNAFKQALIEDVKLAVISKLGLPDNYGTNKYNNGQYAKEHPGTDINTNILNVELLNKQVEEIGDKALPKSQIILGEDLLSCYKKAAEDALCINKTQAQRLLRNLDERNRAMREFSGYFNLNKDRITLKDFLAVFERRIDEIYKVATFCKFIDPNNFY